MDQSNLKFPLQALLISPDHVSRASILYGSKAITIREGHRDYRPGPVLLACHLEPWCVMAEITQVRHCLLQEVTKEEMENDGYFTKKEMLADMRRYYPKMVWISPVTVIRWANVKGWLRDNEAHYRHRPSGLYASLSHTGFTPPVLLKESKD